MIAVDTVVIFSLAYTKIFYKKKKFKRITADGLTVVHASSSPELLLKSQNCPYCYFFN